MTTCRVGSLTPVVSIVVPVYNGEHTVAACIESLLGQEYPKERYEVIVVDNNSSDGTAGIVRSYPVRLLIEQMQSAYAARNTGVRGAVGEIVALTDADCVAHPHWLRHLVKHFMCEEVTGVAGQIAPYPASDLAATFLGDAFRYIDPEADEPLAVPTGNVAYRRQALLDVGLFDPTFLIGGDIDLSWRIQIQTGDHIVYEPAAIVYHKYRTGILNMFKQMYGYGYGEMVLTTICKDGTVAVRTPRTQLRYMLRQVWALAKYVCSFVYRSVVWLLCRREREYPLWPLLWLVAEGGNLLGKLRGLIATRCFHRNPYSL